MKINKNLLQKNIIKETIELHPFYYCLVKKESDSGLLLNQRMLFLQQSDFSVYYSKDIPSSPYSKSAKLPTGKIKLRISEINASMGSQKNSVSIDFPKQKIKWVFFFSNDELAKKWLKLLDNLQMKICRLSLDRKSLKSTKSSNSILSLDFQDCNKEKTLTKSSSFGFFEKKQISLKKILELQKIQEES